MGLSFIVNFDNHKDGFCLCSALLANPSTGKTQALTLVKNSLLAIEESMGVNHKDSKLANK